MAFPLATASRASRIWAASEGSDGQVRGTFSLVTGSPGGRIWAGAVKPPQTPRNGLIPRSEAPSSAQMRGGAR
jgi:hypothetical protein